MEPIVYEDSPLADYLREESSHRRDPHHAEDASDAEDLEWPMAPVANSSDRPLSISSNPSPPPSPTPFAPTGRPVVKPRYRKNPAEIPRLDITHAQSPSLRSIRRHCSVRPLHSSSSFSISILHLHSPSPLSVPILLPLRVPKG